MHVFFIFILLFNISFSLLANPPLATVDVDKASIITNTETSEFVGHVIATESSNITSQISGKAEQIFVKTGDFVKKNDPLILINQDIYKLELDTAKNNLNIAHNNLIQAEIEQKQSELIFNRQKELKNSPGFSKALYENAENSLQASKNKVNLMKLNITQMEIKLELAKLNLSYTIIKAPFSGIITKKTIRKGTHIIPGSQTVTLLNIKNLEIEVNIPRKFYKNLKPNDNINFIFNNKTYNSILRSIILEENPTTHTVPLRLTPDKKIIKSLLANQALSIIIPNNTKIKKLTISKDALLNKNGMFFVYIAKDGIAKLKPVTISESIADRVIVNSGVDENDLIIVKGNERLYPNQPITIRNK